MRRLCTHCKEKYVPEKKDMPPDFPWELLEKAGGQIYRAVGCRECRQVGYRGRSGIYELLTTSNPVREVTGKNATAWEIKKLALSEGMTTLRMDAWRKTLAGETSVEEVVGNTKQDEYGGA
jgi:general secretion pathway protein E/type IV pilus assembly protein PilB